MENQEHIFISPEQFEALDACLSSLAKKLRVSAVLLVDSSGRVIAKSVSPVWHCDSQTIGSLTAGVFAASSEMARQLDEPDNFTSVLHEGKKTNVFVSSANKNSYLVTIYETGVALGMVRLLTKRTLQQIAPIVENFKLNTNQLNQVFNQQFRQMLGNELDQAFGE